MQLHRSQMITLARGRYGSTTSRVLEHTRAQGVVARDELAQAVDTSPATISRAVAALCDAGFLRERTDRARTGAVGRPGVPFEIDPDHFVVLGLHLGRRVATVSVGDLTGRVLAHRTRPRDPDDPVDAAYLGSLGSLAADLLGGLAGRRPLAAGLVAPWLDLGLDPEATGALLHEVLGLPVATADHIAAVAAAEFLHKRAGTPGVTLYVYARNTVGHAIAIDKGFQTEVSRVGNLTHFPTGSDAACTCGHTGCLEPTVADHAVTTRAQAERLLVRGEPGIEAVYAAAATGGARAHALLVERARTLGRVAAHVRDKVLPHPVILVGQAFTGYSPALADVVASFEETTALGPVDLQFTRFGAGIQSIAACTIGLGPVYDDPLALAPLSR